MVTNNEVGRKGASNSALVWHCGDRGLFSIWTCWFPVELKNFFLNRRGGTNLRDEYSNNWEFADFLGGSPGITYWRSYSWEEHFVPLCLFVKTSPVYLPVASGNGNMFFTQKLHVQIANNPRSPQSQTESQWWSPSRPTSFFAIPSTSKLRMGDEVGGGSSNSSQDSPKDSLEYTPSIR
jgi:hypothetical protein